VGEGARLAKGLLTMGERLFLPPYDYVNNIAKCNKGDKFRIVFLSFGNH
jgi:hypothetical protein